MAARAAAMGEGREVRTSEAARTPAPEDRGWAKAAEHSGSRRGDKTQVSDKAG